VADVRPYLRLLGAQTRGQAQYRVSFWFDLVGSVAFGLADLAAVVVLFNTGGTLGGFTRAEGLLMAAIATAGFALADLVLGGHGRLRLYIRTGQFDAILLRPLSALGQLVAMDFSPRRLGRLAVSATLIPLAAGWAAVDWTAARIVLAVIAPVAGAVIFGGVIVITTSVSFWWIESGEFSAGFTYGGRDFTSYPVTIYDLLFRRLFGYWLGFAFTGYYPALVLLDRSDPLGGPAWLGFAGPLAAVVSAAVSALVWRAGIRQYRSTGS
jgi:ABC-2 type transport system permease protein